MGERTHEELIEERIRKLEERLDLIRAEKGEERGRTTHPAWPFFIGLASLPLAYLGLGFPNHIYQVLFAGLVMLLAYHRGLFRLASGGWLWPQAILNLVVLCLLLKFLLGAGVEYPLGWLKLPVLMKSASQGDSSWYRSVIPDMSIQWQGIPGLSTWSVDMTKVQTFLLIATLAGALFRFQPFASLTALVLLVVSIPSYLAFNWDNVVPFLILAGVSLYLQTVSVGHRSRG